MSEILIQHVEFLIAPKCCNNKLFEFTCYMHFAPATFWHPPKLQTQRMNRDVYFLENLMLQQNPTSEQTVNQSTFTMACIFSCTPSLLSNQRNPPHQMKRVGRTINKCVANLQTICARLCIPVLRHGCAWFKPNRVGCLSKMRTLRVIFENMPSR